jgi:hypothetical protein
MASRDLSRSTEKAMRAPIARTATETQATICAWADVTFGPVTSALSIGQRAMLEMDELILALAEDDGHPKATEEAADVIIILMRLFASRGEDFMDVVSRKMVVNRAREWRLTGTGHGFHVKSESEAA